MIWPLDLFVGNRRCRSFVRHLDDVIPEVGCHDVADSPGFSENATCENAGTISPAIEIAEIAALRRAPVLRVLLGQRGEVLTGARALEEAFDLRSRLFSARPQAPSDRDLQQDVAGADRSVLLELVGILVVERTRFRVRR